MSNISNKYLHLYTKQTILRFSLGILFTDNKIAHHHNQSYQYQRQVHVRLDKIVLPKAFYDLLAKEEKTFDRIEERNWKYSTFAE